MIPQLIGGAVSIAGAIPNKLDRQQRGIAMGGEDPALAAIRRQLAAQNAQTAMSVAASQQGVNPALAQRNAQQALAQQQVQTNTEFARLGAQSAMQARSDDSMGRKIAGVAQGAGQLLNVFGTGMAAQNAGMAAGKPEGVAGMGQALSSPQVDPAITDAAIKQQLLAAQTPMQTQSFSGPQSAMGLAAPSQAAPVDPSLAMFNLGAPAVPSGGSPLGQLQPSSGPQGSGVAVPPTTFQSAPAQPQGPQVPAIPPIQFQQPNMTPGATQAEAMSQMGAPTPAAPGQLQTASPPAPATPGLGDVRSRGVPSLEGGNPNVPEPQFRASDMLPPEVTSRPQNAGLLQTYDEAAARGDQALMDILRNILAVNF
jgi:hypothetical protein